MQHRLLSHQLSAAASIPSIIHPTLSLRPQQSTFHTSSRAAAQHDENHYNTLESAPTSSQSHLKKQFYALSKKHHPDLHPDDSSASQRFIRISAAWSILGNESKRAQYDRDLFRQDPSLFGGSSGAAAAGRGGPMPSGSHSSAQAQGGAAAWGARPASGLSRRRGAFRGPPPSFYRSGGWGAQETKRRAAVEGAEEGARRAADQSNANGDGGGFGGGFGDGFSPGQGRGHADFEVPHFDREGHFRRQESVEEALKRRRSAWAERQAIQREDETSSTWARIGIVSGALVTTGLVSIAWEAQSKKKRK